MKYKAVVRVDIEVEFEDDPTRDLLDQAMDAAADVVGSSMLFMEVVDMEKETTNEHP